MGFKRRHTFLNQAALFNNITKRYKNRKHFKDVKNIIQFLDTENQQQR